MSVSQMVVTIQHFVTDQHFIKQMLTTQCRAECPICLQKLPGRDNKVTEVVCPNNHQICQQCLDSLLSSKLCSIGCPSCRQPMLITPSRIKLARQRTGSPQMAQSSDMILPTTLQTIPQPPPTCSLLTLYPGLLTILLVWSTLGLNCWYFLSLGGNFCFVLLYVVVSQVWQLTMLSHTWVAEAVCSERTRAILKQSLFFTMAINLKERTVLGVMFYLKEVLLVMAVVIIQMKIREEWTIFSIIVLLANVISLLFYWILSIKIKDPVVENWTIFLNNHPLLQTLIMTLFILLNNSYIFVWCYLTYKLHPLAMVGHLILPILQLISSLQIFIDNRKSLLHLLYSLPYGYSYTIFTSGRLVRWLCFLQRYLELPVLLGYVVSQTTKYGECWGIERSVAIVGFLMSLVAVVEVPVGGTLKANAFRV